MRKAKKAEPAVQYQYGTWAPNRNVSAQVVGETIEAIRRQHRGTITPKQLVDAGRPADSPIHDAFEWRPEVAVELYNEHVASQLIRCTEIHNPNLATRPSEIAYVSIGSPKTGSLFTSTKNALSDAKLRQHVVDDIIRQLRGLQSRFEHIEELQGLWAELDRIAFANAAKVAPRPRPKAKRGQADGRPR